MKQANIQMVTIKDVRLEVSCTRGLIQSPSRPSRKYYSSTIDIAQHSVMASAKMIGRMECK
jgi:hypothetical protein